MPDGGRLVIETHNHSFDTSAALQHHLAAGEYVSLSVTDGGVGMAPEVVRRAFDPFFTTKPTGMGTGLGLSMVGGLVQQSGGQAEIVSEPGQGTSVHLFLPRHSGRVDSPDTTPKTDPTTGAKRSGTVLVVDDEPAMLLLVTETLQDFGYSVLNADDGASALKILRSSTHLDLLITDVGLPGGMNGRQVADAARVVRPGLKVLFITGYAEKAVLNHGDLEPGMRILTKPFAIDALTTTVDAVTAANPPVSDRVREPQEL
jgi:CheY-like chemotaxis protein